MIALATELKRRLRRLVSRPESAPDPAVAQDRARLNARTGPTSGSPEQRIAAGLAELDAGRSAALLADLSAILGEDGAPKGRMQDAEDALWAAALGRAWLKRAGQAADPTHEGLLISGIHALYHLQGDQTALPGLSSEQGPEAPLAHTLYRVMQAWSLDNGAPAAFAGARWSMWAWRSTGLAVAHSSLAKRPGRVFADGREGRVSLDLSGLGVVTGEVTVGDGDGAGGALQTARVDGRKVRLIAHGPGWTRDALAQGSRLIVRDQGLSRVVWTLGSAWSLEPTDAGYLGRADGLTLEIKLEPTWRWTLDGAVLQGVRGAGLPEVQTSFEIRT